MNTHTRTHTHTHHTHTHVQVYEETGLDIRDLIKEDQFLEAKVGDNLTRMYIIPGVQDSTPFAPKTRKEIRVRGSGKRGEEEGVRKGGGGTKVEEFGLNQLNILVPIFATVSILSPHPQSIQWFKIEDLPRHRKDLTSKQALGKSANTFFLIIPFMR